ncbi:MAG: hypothetical protein IKG01_14725 [Lachnospiraceae bacterium]|nr:hypothetical protein [Lachnospiraceae bacterium]
MRNGQFGEKEKEFSAKAGKKVPVWKTPKYEQSRAKALEVIDTYQNIKEGDFWILMNETKKGDKMLYSGLIISHNACLKINDQLKEEDKFVPSCVSLDKSGYADSLVYSYCNDEQGIYEVGEVSRGNCKNAYPYAMAYKRLFDRVVLKNSKIAYDGIYSDSEAEEFRQPEPVKEETAPDAETILRQKIDKAKQEAIKARCEERGVLLDDLMAIYKVTDLSHLSNRQFMNIHDNWDRIEEELGGWTSADA